MSKLGGKALFAAGHKRPLGRIDTSRFSCRQLFGFAEYLRSRGQRSLDEGVEHNSMDAQR